jgi:hypothetical protein
MRAKARDFPFDEVVSKANKIIEQGQFLVLQKFTCQHCGQRLTMDEPNMFFAEGGCDKCGKLTDIRKRGCNYLLVSNNQMMHEVLQRVRGQ